MVGSIDPRCETIRGTHWPVKVAGVFGTRVAETILASGPPTASTGRTYGCKRSGQTMEKLLRHGGRPHMGLGLSLGAAIAKLHGFRLAISPGPGCRVEIICPGREGEKGQLARLAKDLAAS